MNTANSGGTIFSVNSGGTILVSVNNMGTTTSESQSVTTITVASTRPEPGFHPVTHLPLDWITGPALAGGCVYAAFKIRSPLREQRDGDEARRPFQTCSIP